MNWILAFDWPLPLLQPADFAPSFEGFASSCSSAVQIIDINIICITSKYEPTHSYFGKAYSGQILNPFENAFFSLKIVSHLERGMSAQFLGSGARRFLL